MVLVLKTTRYTVRNPALGSDVDLNFMYLLCLPLCLNDITASRDSWSPNTRSSFEFRHFSSFFSKFFSHCSWSENAKQLSYADLYDIPYCVSRWYLLVKCHVSGHVSVWHLLFLRWFTSRPRWLIRLIKAGDSPDDSGNCTHLWKSSGWLRPKTVFYNSVGRRAALLSLSVKPPENVVKSRKGLFAFDPVAALQNIIFANLPPRSHADSLTCERL